jgi:hypothetical protein
MFDAFLKTRQIVIVQIYVFWIVTVEAFRHIRTTVTDASGKSGHTFEAYLLRNQSRQSEIDKNVFLVGGAQHYVIWLNVHMDQMKAVHQSQIQVEVFRVDFAVNWRANFHRKFDALLVHQNVKAQTGLNFGPNFQSRGDFEKGPLLDGSVPVLFPFGGDENAFKRYLFP